jgi:beta-fructofuranosidase
MERQVPEHAVAQWEFSAGIADRIRESVSGLYHPILDEKSKGWFQPKIDPEWLDLPGLPGSALIFDGYSTEIHCPDILEDTSFNAGLSINFLIAPRAFEPCSNGEFAAVISKKSHTEKTGFAAGLLKHGQFGFEIGNGKQFYRLTAESEILPRYTWSFISCVFDANTRELRLYLNTELAARRIIDIDSIVLPANELLIGRNNDTYEFPPFKLNRFSGALASLSVYLHGLDKSEISAEFQQLCGAAFEKIGGRTIGYRSLGLKPDAFLKDKHRPQYHLCSPGHWMNEPHAPMYYNGQYHIFFQQNLSGPYWGNINWGHFVSKDMINWRIIREAIVTEKGSAAPDGIWSGSAIIVDNEPIVLVTAGNFAKDVNQAPAVAHPLDCKDPDLTYWKLEPQTLFEQCENQGLRGEFRDPFIFRKGGRFFILMGSGLPGRHGMALVYSSLRIEGPWKFHGPVLDSDLQLPEQGSSWELPVLLSVSNDDGIEKEVFLYLPHGEGSKNDIYYFIGHFDTSCARFIPDQVEPRLLDHGGEICTGPSGFVDPVTHRSILFTIAQGKRTLEEEYRAGWAHGGGVPLSLRLSGDGRELRFSPIEELDQLRLTDNLFNNFSNLTLVNQKLRELSYDALDIRLVIHSKNRAHFMLQLRKSPTSSEETRIIIDTNKQKLILDRSDSSLDRNGLLPAEIDIFQSSEYSKIRILLDRSLLEIFADDRTMITSRIYPRANDAKQIELSGDVQGVLQSLSITRMDSIAGKV